MSFWSIPFFTALAQSCNYLILVLCLGALASRILICLMCGDGFNMEMPLAPLLNHQFCYVTSDEYIALETYLDDSKRKVEVTTSSYHGASQLRHSLYHGYILVYWCKRRGSLANLK